MSFLDISYVFIDRKERYKPIYITQAYQNIPKTQTTEHNNVSNTEM